MNATDSTRLGPDLLALSDDFTGCVSLAGECRSVGVPALVQTWNRPLPAEWIGVTVVDTQSRLASAAVAADRVRYALELAADDTTFPELRVFKRFDSGLRGQVGAELEAVVHELGQPCVIASAAPALGVSVEHGHHLLQGTPVHETEYGTDPAGPATSYLPAFLKGSTASIGLEDVRGRELPEKLARAVAHVRYVVLDGRTSEDLAAAATAVATLSETVVLAGTYGFGAMVARASTTSGRVGKTGVLAVVGSMRRTSIAQVDRACADGAAVFVCLANDALDEVLADSAAQSLAGGQHVVLLTQHPDRMVDASWNPSAAPRLATLAAQVCERVTPTALVLVGGETSAQTVEATGVTRCRVIAEPWPTAALLVAEGGCINGVLVVTKSGALGDEAWLSEAITLMEKLASGGATVLP